MLKIVADQAIPFAERFFSRIGEVSLFDGREIDASALATADVLVCRTVTRVNQSLLENSSLRLVASATSGLDHIDQDYLQERAIGLVSAPGCNARSVAEYVLSALCVLQDQRGFDLRGKTAAIIGCGHVGSLVLGFLQALGLECLVCDPFLEAPVGGGRFCTLDETRRCDIITLHVPLTDDGPWPTRAMLDGDYFRAVNNRVILVNTARGGVIDERVLLGFLQHQREAMAVIDCWCNEPAIDRALLQRADIATPHIAGYSIDSKLRASSRVFEETCRLLQLTPAPADPDEGLLPVDARRRISLARQENDMHAVSLAVLASYDVRSDAAALRRMLEDRVSDSQAYFAELRNHYPIRREFSTLQLGLPAETDSLCATLQTLGFRIGDMG